MKQKKVKNDSKYEKRSKKNVELPKNKQKRKTRIFYENLTHF